MPSSSHRPAVDIELLRVGRAPILRVVDMGCGIAEQERQAVLRRFYRSDKIRNTPGVGLGLSLVSAIVKLHEFRLVIYAGPGGRVEIVCPKSQTEGKEEVRRTSAAMSNDPERKSRMDMAIEMSGANNAQKGAGILTSLPQASRPTRRQWCRWRVPRIDLQTML
jgi:hypothetical protein